MESLVDKQDTTFHGALAEEVRRARMKHPSTAHLLAALTEEVGELAQALLDQDSGARPVTDQEIYKEAVQVACVALRLAVEGDGEFRGYDCPEFPRPHGI